MQSGLEFNELDFVAHQNTTCVVITEPDSTHMEQADGMANIRNRLWVGVGGLEAGLSWLARPLRIALGYVWALALMLIGLWLWEQHGQPVHHPNTWLEMADPLVWSHIARSLAIFAIAGGGFVFMFLVADDLCPKAPTIISEFLEFFSGMLAIGALLWAGWLTWARLL